MESSFLERYLGKTWGKIAAIIIVSWTVLFAYITVSKFAYDNAQKNFEERIKYFELRINDLEERVFSDSTIIDSLTSESTQLKTTLYKLRTTKIVLKDTLIYEGEAITLFDGHLVIYCDKVGTKGQRFADIVIRTIDARDTLIRGGLRSLNPDDLRSFEYKKKKYILALLGCRQYENGLGARIAVYKE